MAIHYFDTSVFSRAVQQHGYDEKKLLVMASALRDRGDSVVASCINLAEAQHTRRRDPALGDQILRLVFTVVDADRIIKPDEVILSELVRSYARGCVGFWSPFIVDRDELRHVRDGLLGAQDRGFDEEFGAFMHEWKGSFRATMSGASVDARQEASNLTRVPTFPEYFAASAPLFAQMLAENYDAGWIVRLRGTEELLAIRPVYVHVLMTLSYCFRFTFERFKADPGDSGDFLHAVSASVAHTFVTGDRGLFELLQRVTVAGWRVRHIDDFLLS